MQIVQPRRRYGPATYRDWDPAEWADTQYGSTSSRNVSVIERQVQSPVQVRIRVKPRQRGPASDLGRYLASPKPDWNQSLFVSFDTLAKHLEVPTELTSSAFAEREYLRINERDIHEILSGVEANPLIVGRARIAARLRKLFEVRVEEEHEHEPMSADSLRCFVRFLATVPNAHYPDIGLSPDGSLVVEWRLEARATYITEFLPDQRAVVLLILQDAQYPYQYRRITSTVPVGSLRDFLQCNEAIALIEAQPTAK